MDSVCPLVADPHLSLSMNFAAIGPSKTPINTAGTVSLSVSGVIYVVAVCVPRTCFTQVPLGLDLD